MKQALAKLVELNGLDEEMRALRRKDEQLGLSLRNEETSVAGAERALDLLKTHLRELQHEVDQRNGRLKAAEEVVLKLRGQLQSLKTNAEYAAMQRQIDARVAETSVLEDNILEAMEIVEEARRGLPAREASLAQAKEALELARGRNGKQSAAIRERLQDLMTRWETAAGDLEPGILDRYVRVRDRRGVGLAQVGTDRICQGCHVSITAQLLNQVVAGHAPDCPSCGRILVSSR